MLVTPATTLSAGEYSLDVYYKFATDSTVRDSFTIIVTDSIDIVEIKEFSPAEITEYQVEDSVSLRGLRLFAVFNDNSEIEIVNGGDIAQGVSYSPEFIGSDTTQIVITYMGLTYSYQITVLDE